MSKRRKKTNTNKLSLKFEVYGILIIVFSIIALIGEGSLPYINPFGKALRSICVFLAGHFHFIVPIIFIYLGLYVMMKRSWPKKWTYRKTGVVLAIIAILISYHISLFERPIPEHTYTIKTIISDSYVHIKEAIINPQLDRAETHIGGGMIGALLFSLLQAIFGYMGTIIIVIAMFTIAFLCITGLSIVDVLRKIKKQTGTFFLLLRKRWRDKRKGKRIASVADSVDATVSATEQVGLEAPDGLGAAHRSELGADHIAMDTPERVNSDDQRVSSVDVIKRERSPLILRLLKAEEAAAEQRTLADEMASMADGAPLYRDFQHNSEAKSTLELDAELDPDGVIIKDDQADGDTQAGATAASSTEEVNKKPYQLPPFHLLAKAEGGKGSTGANYRANARKLEQTLESFGVKTKVVEVVRGPAVTRYELQPDVGVKVSRIVSLTDDIALALAAKDIRMEAPIPGKAAIGIEVPNTDVAIVTMREVMESNAFMNSSSKLSITLGRDIAGQPIIGNLAKMPHLLVAGATGSGKSVCVNSIIVSILYKAKPDEVKFLMIDPKKVELNVYNGIPHLLAPVVTDPRRASLALKKIVAEMEQRYELFSQAGARNIEAYNEMMANDPNGEPLPLIVVIVDELADLMMVAAKDVEDAICRLAQMARAAGIHLIIATQRPSVDVITGLIKANIPSRIAFAVSSQIDSRTILDSVGAEKLLGRGDMLFLPVGASKPTRVQGAFLADHEVEAVVNFVKEQAEADYQEELVPEVEEASEQVDEQEDELFDQAVRIILEARQASVSLLQRRMRVGYTRAGRLIDSMEAQGIIGPYEGSKPREVLMTLEQFLESRKNS